MKIDAKNFKIISEIIAKKIAYNKSEAMDARVVEFVFKFSERTMYFYAICRNVFVKFECNIYLEEDDVVPNELCFLNNLSAKALSELAYIVDEHEKMQVFINTSFFKFTQDSLTFNFYYRKSKNHTISLEKNLGEGLRTLSLKQRDLMDMTLILTNLNNSSVIEKHIDVPVSLKSIFFNLKDESTDLVATDGKRVIKMELDVKNNRKFSFLMSAELFAVMCRLNHVVCNTKKTCNITLNIHQRHLVSCFKDEENGTKIYIKTPILFNNFPDYESLFKKTDQGKYIIFNRKDLIAITRKIKPFLDNFSSSLKLKFEKNSITLSSASSINNLLNSENAKKMSAIGIYELSGVRYIGGNEHIHNTTIGFNIDYFLHALRVVKHDEIKLYINSSFEPCLFRNANTEVEKDSSIIEALLMPMKI